jgi:putative ABC transport system ATP-binding protein
MGDNMDVRVEKVSHTYAAEGLEARTVLDIDSWTVASGDQVLLRGISGSGKTTLMNVIAGLLPPTDGEVLLDDEAIYVLPEAARDRLRARRIGYVFQIHLLVPTLTAVENVEMPLVFARQHAGSARRARAQEILEEVGLGDFFKHKPAQLSAGQRLRVAVARALVAEPDLLLADEPTAALDGVTAATVMDLIQQSCRRRNATLLVASHDPELNPRFDRIVDLQAGHLVDERSAT